MELVIDYLHDVVVEAAIRFDPAVFKALEPSIGSVLSVARIAAAETGYCNPLLGLVVQGCDIRVELETVVMSEMDIPLVEFNRPLGYKG